MTAGSAAAEFDFHDQRCIQISLPQGSRAIISLYGAQVLSWQTADGREYFYLSPKAVMNGSSAIRGGVPVCFPQFNQRWLAGRQLPKHGFARNQTWTVTSVEQSNEAVQARFQLSDSDSTLAVWPHAFKANLIVDLKPDYLRITFEVANLGSVPWPFALALHSYLAVADVRLITVAGLAGRRYWDGVKNLNQPAHRDIQLAGLLAFQGETDRVYENVSGPLELAYDSGRLLITQSASLPDAVVWNPGAELCATLPNMPINGWEKMVCIEAARINSPELLAPGQPWSGWQQFEAF